MPKPKTKVPTEAKTEPNLVYPEFEVKTYSVADGTGLTAEDAKALLGWEEEGDVQFTDYFLTDRVGKKVRLKNNVQNRPWSEPWTLHLMQDMLRKNWYGLNGETMGIGKSGQVYSAQHRLIALVFAEQERTNPKKAEYWSAFWGEGPVTIDAVICFGIDDNPALLRTIDNVRPRSLSDVLFTDPSMFKGFTNPQKQRACSILDHAVKLLWTRLGMKNPKESYSPYRTHSEALEFIERHGRIKKCVNHIAKECFDKDSVLSKYISPGMAAGFMYLMAASGSDGDDYHHARREEKVNEGKMDWSYWDKAHEFWTTIAKGNAQQIREAVAFITNDEDSGGVVTAEEKIGILLKAWNIWKDGGKVTASQLKLRYVKDEDEVNVLVEYPSVGGIDLGHPKDQPETGEVLDGTESEDEDEPTPEEIEEIRLRKAAEDRRRRAEEVTARLDELSKKKQPSAAGPTPPFSQKKPPAESGTKHDFEESPDPETITNKEGVVLKKKGEVRVPGIEGVKWTVLGFFPSIDASNRITVMAKLSKVGDGKHTSNVAVDNLLPGEKEKGMSGKIGGGGAKNFVPAH